MNDNTSMTALGVRSTWTLACMESRSDGKGRGTERLTTGMFWSHDDQQYSPYCSLSDHIAF